MARSIGCKKSYQALTLLSQVATESGLKEFLDTEPLGALNLPLPVCLSSKFTITIGCWADTGCSLRDVGPTQLDFPKFDVMKAGWSPEILG